MRNISYIHHLFIFGLALYTYSSGECQESPKIIEAEHSIVYSVENRFAGWPANCAATIFQGDEIVVGFIEGGYELQDGHNLAEPYNVWLARSKDGGETWETSNPDKYVGDYGSLPDLQVLEEAINFKDPGFMMRIVGTGYHGAEDPRGHFFYSYDRGVNWKGPYRLNINGLGNQLTKYSLNELTPRTDYVITGENDCMLFLSAREKGVFGTDRLFCIKTMDGGLNFEFTGWVISAFEDEGKTKVPKVNLYEDKTRNPYATECRAVMSSSLKSTDGTLLSAIRRKYIVKGGTDKH